MTFADRLAAAVADRGPICLGIDPHPGLLREWGLADDAAGLRDFGLRAVEAAGGRAAAVKPQVAFFERHGVAGFAALEETLAAARHLGLVAIADAKRGDIGSTVEGYAAAWLGAGSSLEADAVTASPYLGVGALEPLLTLAESADKGVFVLAATSNPEAVAVQTARLADGRTVARTVVDELRGRPGAGVVVGATIDLDDYGLDAAALDDLPVLAPGFGAQGARLDRLPAVFGAAAPRVLASVSRSVLGAGPTGLADALDRARQEVSAWHD